jgi:hypothetical protein
MYYSQATTIRTCSTFYLRDSVCHELTFSEASNGVALSAGVEVIPEVDATDQTSHQDFAGQSPFTHLGQIVRGISPHKPL